MTGMILDRDAIYYNLETMPNDKPMSDFPVAGACSESGKVIFSRNSNAREVAFCESNNCKKGAQLVVATPVVVRTRKTECRYPRFLKSCDGYFKSSSSPIWKQSQYGKCGWLGGKRYRRCDEINMRVKTDDPEEAWIIREVEEFNRPDARAAPVVSVLQGTVEGIQDSLVTVGIAVGAFVSNVVVKNGAPGFGVLVALSGIQGQFGGSDKEAALANLAAEILANVDNRIDQAIVKSDLEQAATLLDEARKRYLIDYVADKKGRFNTNGQPLNQSELLSLS